MGRAKNDWTGVCIKGCQRQPKLGTPAAMEPPTQHNQQPGNSAAAISADVKCARKTLPPHVITAWKGILVHAKKHHSRRLNASWQQQVADLRHVGELARRHSEVLLTFSLSYDQKIKGKVELFNELRYISSRNNV